jgi:hypothetical protein
MYDYKIEHYKFIRDSGAKRGDFVEEPDCDFGDWLVLGVAVTIFILLVVL